MPLEGLFVSVVNVGVGRRERGGLPNPGLEHVESLGMRVVRHDQPRRFRCHTVVAGVGTVLAGVSWMLIVMVRHVKSYEIYIIEYVKI